MNRQSVHSAVLASFSDFDHRDRCGVGAKVSKLQMGGRKLGRIAIGTFPAREIGVPALEAGLLRNLHRTDHYGEIDGSFGAVHLESPLNEGVDLLVAFVIRALPFFPATWCRSLRRQDTQ
jgi:hypothetical protein